MSNCLFCRITRKELPAEIIYEDDRVMVIKDINPKAQHHYLVIPHQHLENLLDASEADAALLGHMCLVSKKVAKSLNLITMGYRTIFNTGSGAGQEVFHIHAHILAGPGKLPGF